MCTIECFFANNEKESALRLIRDLVLNIESQGDEAKSGAWATINSILLRDKADNILRDYFLESKNT